MYSILTTRSRIACRCSAANEAKENPINVARKAFEKKRAVNAKENLNKVLLIAKADFNEYITFFKGLEEIHREEFLVLHDKAIAPLKKLTEQSTDEVAEETDENIFKKVD